MKCKVLVLMVVIFNLASLNVFALDPMGPTAAGLKQGESRIGFEYGYSDSDFEFSSIPSLGVSAGKDDLEVQKYYGVIGTGISDDIEAFVRIGAAKVQQDDLDSVIGDADGLAFGGGLKATLKQEDNVKWGVLAQLNWMDTEFDTNPSLEISMLELQIAFGPTVQISDNFSVYGGPFLKFVDGDLELSGTSVSSEISEDSILGGYLGMQIDVDAKENQIGNGYFIFGEGQYTNDGWGLATGIGWKF